MGVLSKKQGWKLIVIVLVLVLGLTYGVQMVGQNQENRSKATSEGDNVVMCGSSNKLTFVSRPVADLCVSGLPIWIDSVASEGVYKWNCVDASTGESSECSAFLED